MLYSIESGTKIQNIPHKKDYERWMNNLSSNDLIQIEAELNNKIDKNDVNTAGWMPGSDWTGTVFYPIYEACKKNVDQAAMFFGLIVYKVFMDRPEWWSFGEYEVDGRPIGSKTYFKLNNLPVI